MKIQWKLATSGGLIVVSQVIPRSIIAGLVLMIGISLIVSELDNYERRLKKIEGSNK